MQSAALFRTLCTIQECEVWRRARCWGNCWKPSRGIGRFILKVVFRALNFMKRGAPHPSRRLVFFILLISSAVIATLGLISNSTAVVIGAMIVAPLMDPILSLAFGLAVSDGKLIRRSVVCVSFYGAEQQFYVESVALIRLDDSVQRVVALLLSDASSEGSVGLN